MINPNASSQITQSRLNLLHFLGSCHCIPSMLYVFGLYLAKDLRTQQPCEHNVSTLL